MLNELFTVHYKTDEFIYLYLTFNAIENLRRVEFNYEQILCH